MLKKLLRAASMALAILCSLAAFAQDNRPIKIALIASKTGPSEAYARDTERGLRLGLEYLTQNTMMILGRKIEVIVKDDQMKPDLSRALLTEAFGDDKADIAVGTSWSGGAMAMLPVAEEYKKILMLEPAIADSLTGQNWNRYLFRASRNSFQDSAATAVALKDGDSVAFLAPDYIYGRTLKKPVPILRLTSEFRASPLKENTDDCRNSLRLVRVRTFHTLSPATDAARPGRPRPAGWPIV